MQTPAGYEIKDVGRGDQAFMTSFQDVVFTPSFGPRFSTCSSASWMVGASLVLSVAAFYLLQKRHVELAKTMIRVALPIFTVLAMLQVVVLGANQATAVATEQPEKLAAMEGVYPTASCVPMTIIGWVDPSTETTSGLQVPCLLSLLVGTEPRRDRRGLETFPTEDRPTVNIVFQVYHLMINLGTGVHPIGGLGLLRVVEAQAGTSPLAAAGCSSSRSCSPSWRRCRAGGPPSSVASRGSSGTCCAPTTPSRRSSRRGRSWSRS